MGRERQNKRQLTITITKILRDIPHQVFQSNPFLPDLLNQPEFLIVPEFGRLVAVYVFAPRRRLSWRNTLAMVEDLFEIKQATGESTIAVAVLIPSEPTQERDAVFLNLLHNLFDGFLVLDEALAPAINELRQIVMGGQPREALFHLWRSERKRIVRNLAEFAEERYASFVDTRRTSHSNKSRILRNLKSEIVEEPDLAVIERYQVRSPKEALANLPERNRFVFDFGVEFLPTERTRPVDVAVLGRYGSRGKLRYLMTKARLTSYAPWQGRLMLRDEPFRPVLMVSGNLAGPEHDPYRYVRALVSVGWELVIATPESMRGVAYADL
jgi:hypothetical protein